MCGITGIMDPSSRLAALDPVIGSMTDSMRSRGPDARGVFVDREAGVALGHRRLSVIDPDPAGGQPMIAASGRHRIVFNGEIYNYAALRSELEREGAVFRTGTDTEVLLECCVRWGVRATLDRLVGMFAFAFLDSDRGRVSLVRDRVGIKPLLLWCDGRSAVFGSELRALESCPLVPDRLDPLAVSSLLTYSCIGGRRSIIRGVEKIRPGTMVTLTLADGELLREDRTWWDPVEVAERVRGRHEGASLEEATDLLQETLGESVRDRLVADVPLGCFLSGGIDSSLVVALAQEVSSAPLRTFTIGMEDRHLDESPHARRIAAHLGTDHVEHRVGPTEALDLIPEMPAVYDEPFADSSQVPTYLVSRIARRDVTVGLSGDGGDELFGGYTRYSLGLQTWNRLRRIPAPLRASLALGARVMPGRLVDAVGGWFGPQELSHRLLRLSSIADSHDLASMHAILATTWPDHHLLSSSQVAPDFADPDRLAGFRDVERMMINDFRTYLVDDILTKVDRASMGVSLEARVPILDHRVAELAWSLPLRTRIDGSEGKIVMRSLLSRYLPTELYERPKMGFSLPVARWLRGPLRDWAEASLSSDLLESRAGLEPAKVRQAWESFLAGRALSKFGIWSILMLSGWLESRA